MTAESGENALPRNGRPTVERALELVDLAYAERDVKVIGWADSMVLDFDTAAGGGEGMKGVTFSAFTDVQRSHESEVLVIAIRVPHPDFMSLEDVLGCEFCGGTGLEWKDYWSADAEPCRSGCAAPSGGSGGPDE